MLQTIAPYGAQLIASGGVSADVDIINLKQLSLKYPNLHGAIVGKAIYEKRVDLKNIIEIANA